MDPECDEPHPQSYACQLFQVAGDLSYRIYLWSHSFLRLWILIMVIVICSSNPSYICSYTFSHLDSFLHQLFFSYFSLSSIFVSVILVFGVSFVTGPQSSLQLTHFSFLLCSLDFLDCLQNHTGWGKHKFIFIKCLLIGSVLLHIDPATLMALLAGRLLLMLILVWAVIQCMQALEMVSQVKGQMM